MHIRAAKITFIFIHLTCHQ